MSSIFCQRTAFVLVVALLCSSSPASSTPESPCLSVTPYVMDVTATSVTVRWESNIKTVGRLCVRGSGAGERWRVMSSSDESDARLHAATAHDLTAETNYEYKVLAADFPGVSDCDTDVSLPACNETTSYFDVSTGRQSWSQGCDGLFLSFKTSPHPGQCDRSFRSWWLGDPGSGVDQGTAAEVEAANWGMSYLNNTWDATFLLGDNAYADGTLAEYRRNLFPFYCRPFAHTGLYPTLGNHDARSSDGARKTGPYFDLFVPGMPTTSSYGSHYSYRHARVHVVMLDLTFDHWDTDADFFAWLESDLSAARVSGGVDWILVASHYPAYTKGSHNSDSSWQSIALREFLLPIFETNGVDVTLSGHSHSYERSHLIRGHYGTSDTFEPSTHLVQAGSGPGSVFRKQRCGNSGTIHVVPGSASRISSSDMSLDHPVFDVSRSAMCTLAIEIKGNSLVSTCTGTRGEIVDRFTIVKSMHAPYCPPGALEFGPACRWYDAPPLRSLAAPAVEHPLGISLITGSPSIAPTGHVFRSNALPDAWSSEYPADWTLASFDDSAWSSAVLPAGYGVDYEWASQLPESTHYVSTRYLFRGEFCLTEPQLRASVAAQLTLLIAADDRASVWLNGVPIFAHPDDVNGEMIYWNVVLRLGKRETGALVAGRNVLAVEVTNESHSSDAGFDGDLRLSVSSTEWPDDVAGDECDSGNTDMRKNFGQGVVSEEGRSGISRKGSAAFIRQSGF